MYEVRLLPVAVGDLSEISRYMAFELDNPAAAKRFLADFERHVSTLSSMPYRRRVYVPLRPLEREYRALAIGSYLAFYWVEEEPEQVVTVARVLYARFDYASQLS